MGPASPITVGRAENSRNWSRYVKYTIPCKKDTPCPTNDHQEVLLPLANGWSLVSGVYNPAPDSFTCGEYVRLVDEGGHEVLYWDSEEWATDPVLVMGAIINAAANKARLQT